MKLLLALAVTLSGLAHADLTDKLIGTWAGIGTSTSAGVKLQSSGTTTYKRFQSHGLTATSIVKIQGNATSRGVARYHDSGKLSGSLMQGGATVAVLSGTWSASEDTLTTKATASGLFPSFTVTTTTILMSKRKLSTAGKSSTGGRSVSTMTKQ